MIHTWETNFILLQISQWWTQDFPDGGGGEGANPKGGGTSLLFLAIPSQKTAWHLKNLAEGGALP